MFLIFNGDGGGSGGDGGIITSSVSITGLDAKLNIRARLSVRADGFVACVYVRVRTRVCTRVCVCEFA